MKLYISTGNSRMEKKWNGQEMEFSVFLERLSHTVRTSETMEQYRKLSKAKQDSIKDVGGFVLGKLKGGRRKKANVLFRSGLTLDMDYATEDIAEQIEMFFDFRCLIYSTHKHTPEKPRLRLIIPLSRTVSPDECAAVARKVAEDIGICTDHTKRERRGAFSVWNNQRDGNCGQHHPSLCKEMATY